MDYIYPDIAFCGGITATVKIASLASLYRIPVATHNVGGILLTMSSIHFGPVVKGGFAGKPELPGLGVDLDDAGVKQIQGAADSPDWV